MMVNEYYENTIITKFSYFNNPPKQMNLDHVYNSLTVTLKLTSN